MTISQRLQFSMVSAPLAQVDRRGLSQAWYSALYGAHIQPPARPQRAGCILQLHADKRIAAQTLPQRDRFAPRSTIVHRSTNAATAVAGERRAPRSELARAIEAKLLRVPRTQRSAATFRLEDGARVRVFFHSSGGTLQLVAVCPPRSVPSVSRALGEVRFALARRGIVVNERAIAQAVR